MDHAETRDVILALVRLINESQIVAGRLRVQGLGLIVLILLAIYLPSWVAHTVATLPMH